MTRNRWPAPIMDLVARMDHLGVGRLAYVGAVLAVQPVPEHCSSIPGRTANRSLVEKTGAAGVEATRLNPRNDGS